MTVVFIPSRNRAELLEKALPKWHEQQNVSHIYVVIERKDYHEYRKLWQKYDKVGISVLPKSDQGINYSRNWIVQEAAELGYDKIIMSDDDIYPRPESDVRRLFEWKGLNCLGIGIVAAQVKRLQATAGVLAIGNFDPKLHSGWGDDELVRQGMFDLKATWYVHAGVNGVSLANRYTKGGLHDLHGENQRRREAAQDESHWIIFNRWGARYVSEDVRPPPPRGVRERPHH